MTRPAYIAIAVPTEGVWYVEAPQVDRATQALRADEVDMMARDLIHIMTDLPPESFDIEIEWRTEFP